MKNEGIPVVKESFPFLFICMVPALAFAVSGHALFSAFFLALTGYVLFFFRNPERLAPVGSATVASPADGKVIFVGQAKDPEFTGEKMQKISIFMSLWDVHVNRVPTDGTVKDMKYHKGRFMMAFEERASEENERSAMLIETAREQKVILVQIAGLVARRIIAYPTIGAFLLKGQRMGLIRFGSRCDLYLPLDANIEVKVGEKVLGGETIVARLKE